MNIFTSKKSLAWRSWLSSYGFSFSMNFDFNDQFDVYIDPSYAEIKSMLNLNNKCSIILSNQKIIKDLGLYSLKSNTFLPEWIDLNSHRRFIPPLEGFVIKVYKIRNINFITYNINFNKYINSSKFEIQNVSPFSNNDEYYLDVLNKTNKTNVFKFMHFIMKNASKQLHKSLVYIWRFPETYNNVFNLRIDVDPERTQPNNEVQHRINQTLTKSLEYKDRITVAYNFYNRSESFLQKTLPKFSKLDLISHNFFHLHFPFKKYTKMNMQKANDILQKFNIETKGFISPEYFWYPHVAEVIEEFGYSYASSFGYDDMNYPYKPIVNNSIRKYFEISSDPCVYSKFKQIDKSEDNILEQYKLSIHQSLEAVDLPCFKYEHPAILGKNNDIFETILDESFDNSLNVLPITLTGFSFWLKLRDDFLNNVSIKTNGSKYPSLLNKSINTFSYSQRQLSIAIESFEHDRVDLYPLLFKNNQYSLDYKLKKTINNFSSKNHPNKKYYSNISLKNKLINIYKHNKKLVKGYQSISRLK